MLLVTTSSSDRSAEPPKSRIHLFCTDVEKMIAVLLFLILKPGAVSAVSSVTFENPDPCALKGSLVEFRCSYNYTDGETVSKTEWSKGELRPTWTRIKLSDLPSYQNRSEYIGDLQHDCSLVIHDLQDNDTGYYFFRFDTHVRGPRRKESVYLSVTELRASVYPPIVRAADNVTLKCGTSCQLPNVVWFKDGHPVAKPEFQAWAEDAGNYACAIKGQESVLSDPVALNVQYPPLNVSVEVSYPDNMTVGSSVNLTCNSAANPAAYSYTWYKSTVSSFTSTVQVGSGQVLSVPSVDVSHTSLYFCQARSRLGQTNSTEVLLKEDEKDIEYTDNGLILRVGIGVKVVIVLLLTPLIVWAWRKRCSSAVGKEENCRDYENVSTAFMGKDSHTEGNDCLKEIREA